VPTYEWQERFWAQFKRLTPEQQAAFLAEIPRFVEFCDPDKSRGACG
jgi:hypothetical protein